MCLNAKPASGQLIVSVSVVNFTEIKYDMSEWSISDRSNKPKGGQ